MGPECTDSEELGGDGDAEGAGLIVARDDRPGHGDTCPVGFVLPIAPAASLRRALLRRLALLQQCRVLRVGADHLALGERVLGDRRLRVGAVEIAGQSEARRIERIDDEMVVVGNFVIPWRARPVIAAVSPRHRAGHRAGIVIDAAHAVRRRSRWLAFRRDGIGIGAHCVPAGPFDHLIAGFLLAPDVVWPCSLGTQKAYSVGIGPLSRMPSTLTVNFLSAAASAPGAAIANAASTPNVAGTLTPCSSMRAMTPSVVLLLSTCLRH